MISPSSDISSVYNFYRNSIFSISNDIQFWNSFLIKAIEDYNEKNEDLIKFESIFNVYNLPHDSYKGFLKTYKRSFKVSTSELQAYRKQFFIWIMNHSILKAYNSCELLLLRSIQLSFFPTLESPLKSRKYAYKIDKEIKSALNNSDSTNNKHLIDFIRLKSPKFETFLLQLIRVDLKTTWANFFEMFSILRNVIAHHGAIVNIDTLNNIKNKAKDIFERHFDLLIDDNGFCILHPKEGDSFLNFIGLLNDFSLNTAKFIFDENDLSFLDLN